LFGVSIATAALPDISRHAAASDHAGIRKTVAQGLRLMLMLNVPATIGLIALANPIVAFLLERGRFTPQDTASTAAALMFYAPGLVGYSAVKIASPTFYSLRDSRTPVIVSVITVLANLGLNITLVRVLGYRGLALGTAIAAVFNAGTLLWLLGRRLDGLDGRRTALAFVKILAASIAMGAAAWWADHALQSVLPTGVYIRKHLDLYLSIRLMLAIAAGVGVLIASARVLRIAEFDDAAASVLRRLGGAKGSR
jgi:putative peptidoglycan lipid II flippase